MELQALSAFAVATIVSFALTPLVAKLAFRVGAVAHVSDRSLHDHDMPSLGGLAILSGLLVASLAFLPESTESKGIIAGALVIALVGTLDDIFDLPPLVKLIGQFCGAAIPVFSGVVVTNFTLPFIDPVALGDWAVPLTMLGIVAVINVVNLTDGADGLAAGVCFIGAATFAIITLSLNRDAAGILAAATAGASLGFLFHNFYPATIFMGDAGSNLLGYLLACIAIQGVLKTAAAVALFFPLVILAVPILDTGFVVAKRLKYGKPIYAADRWHFHHRFVNIGFSQRRTVLYLYAWTLSLAGMALALRFIPYTDGHGNLDTGWTLVLAGIGVLVIIASFYLVVVLEILKLRRFRGRSWRRGQATSEEVDAEVAEELATGDFPAVRPD
ncbi:MAG: undecaprenyl/decaprenyl-phosphate alpha-N-acetylglucosaminyl 1-phosphate transferase [Solirubrobacterales bacterium]|nr:undecaprenyl/decaprenyl-phosphate alpha-N-acetylglucosaminyl 1-phosphate transferase [Solirubrobacterales bacterium]